MSSMLLSIFSSKRRMNTKTWICSAATLLAVLSLSWLLTIFLLPPQYNDSFLGELKYKYERLTDTDGKRIILIGGSSVAFAVRSDLMEEEISDYQVVNFGQYAGLGTKVMLELAEKEIYEGDIVLIIPEISKNTLSLYVNPQALWQALDGKWEMLKCLDREDYFLLLGELPYFAADKMRLFRLPESEKQITGIYSRKAFNEYGDIVWEERDCNRMKGGYDPNQPVVFDGGLPEEDFIVFLNEFAEKAKKKGAAVGYYFCPCNELAVSAGSGGQNAVEIYYRALEDRLVFPIWGNPYNSIMHQSWFYDTNFHLNKAGAVCYTRQLVRDIKLILRDVSRTEIPLPDMPLMADKRGEAGGNNRDADCFMYEEQGEDVVIIGLTEKGMERRELTIPVRAQEKSVSGFTQTAFEQATQLENLTLQENIVRIEDSCFINCRNLKQLVMMGKNPADCMVGEKLLDNIPDCRIVVPEEAEVAYRLSYIWRQYENAITSSNE